MRCHSNRKKNSSLVFASNQLSEKKAIEKGEIEKREKKMKTFSFIFFGNYHFASLHQIFHADLLATVAFVIVYFPLWLRFTDCVQVNVVQ